VILPFLGCGATTADLLLNDSGRLPSAAVEAGADVMLEPDSP
jgi:hypothetical protein